MKLKNDLVLIGCAGLGLILLAGYIKDHAAEAVAALPGVAADAAAGVVIGTGDILGIPRTNETECEKALREGRTWDASFACPAGTFIRSVFD